MPFRDGWSCLRLKLPRRLKQRNALSAFRSLWYPEVIHTDRGPAFHNDLIKDLCCMTGVEQSLTTAYSKEENAIVERANQEVLRHLNALLFDKRVRDKGLLTNSRWCNVS